MYVGVQSLARYPPLSFYGKPLPDFRPDLAVGHFVDGLNTYETFDVK